MKNSLFVIALLSPSVFAAPYIGLEYGITSLDSEYTTNFPADSVSLNPNEASDSFGGFIGYRFDSLGFELGYKQYDADDSRSINILPSSEPGFTQEREWDASVTAKQLTFKPVYFYNVNEKLQLKTGLGLTYTQYKYNSSSHDEFELILNDDVEHNVARDGGEVRSDNVFGAVASVGLEYEVIQNLAIGVSASYQLDSMASTSSFMVNSSYYF